MASERARQLAAQAWCKEKTSGKVMDVDLCEAFAEIIDSLPCPHTGEKDLILTHGGQDGYEICEDCKKALCEYCGK